MIERIPKTHRYRVTEFGFRAALFLTRSYTRVFRSGLALAMPDVRAVDAPLKRCFDNIEREVQAWLDKARLVA